MNLERKVMNRLDAMEAILKPFDDVSRERMLATIILWFLMQHEDRKAALDSLLGSVAELERDDEGEVLQ